MHEFFHNGGRQLSYGISRTDEVPFVPDVAALLGGRMTRFTQSIFRPKTGILSHAFMCNLVTAKFTVPAAAALRKLLGYVPRPG